MREPTRNDSIRNVKASTSSFSVVRGLQRRWLMFFGLCLVLLMTFPSIFGLIYTRIRLNSGSAAILVLGGGVGSRERHGLNLLVDMEQGTGDFPLPDWAQKKPLSVWISRGIPKPQLVELAKAKYIDWAKIHLDNSAVDTVTNFSSMAPQMYEAGVSRAYVVTNDFHMDRAMVIANVILGAYGIEAVPVELVEPDISVTEIFAKCVRDYARSVMWFYAGITGSSFFFLAKLIRG